MKQKVRVALSPPEEGEQRFSRCMWRLRITWNIGEDAELGARRWGF